MAARPGTHAAGHRCRSLTGRRSRARCPGRHTRRLAGILPGEAAGGDQSGGRPIGGATNRPGAGQSAEAGRGNRRPTRPRARRRARRARRRRSRRARHRRSRPRARRRARRRSPGASEAVSRRLSGKSSPFGARSQSKVDRATSQPADCAESAEGAEMGYPRKCSGQQSPRGRRPSVPGYGRIEVEYGSTTQRRRMPPKNENVTPLAVEESGFVRRRAVDGHSPEPGKLGRKIHGAE